MARASLAERLSMETSAYVELQAVLEEERKTIIERDYRTLYKVLARKDAILVRIEGLASRRDGLKGLGSAHETGPAGVADKGPALGASIKGLAREMERAREMNRQNRLIMSASLERVNQALDLMESFFSGGAYGATGHRSGLSLKGARLSRGV